LLFTDSVTDVWKVVGGMFLALLLQGLTYYYSNRIMFLIYYKMTASIRLYLGRRLKNLPLGYFSKQDAALLEMNVKQDAMFLGFTPAIVIGIIKGVITPVMTLLVLAWIDWTLALIAIAGIPMCLFITKLADQQLQKVMNRLQTARKQANRRILDFIRGISVIRSFGLAGSKLLGYQETMDEFRKSSIQLNKKLSPYTALNVIMFELGYVIVLVVGGLKYTAGTIDGVSLICFLILTAALYETLPIMDYVVYKRLMKTTLDSLDDVIQEEDLPQPEIGQEKLPATFGVTLENISFGYTNQEILHKLNLTIPENGITALVGPSGGGKTTTLNLIARFYDIASGSIKIGNVDIRDMRHDTLMQHISFVFQDVYLMPDTIMNNLKFGNPHASFEEVVAAAKLACCHEFIMEFPEGYDTQISDGGANLSGGQKQRISIARALLKDAPIVLLDEATASVDPENELYIREALQVLAQHKTVIMVAHRLHTIRNATKIAVIEDGNVVESGSHEELFTKNGRYKQFWQERQRAEQWQVEI
jgi:ABC-type multidrug transport system fused ATPase/permease subunit